MNGLLAGAHVSIAGGIHLAFERGVRLDCRTIQVFLKNSNQWKAKELSDVDRALFLEAQKRCSIRPVIAHDSYLINLASPDRQLRARSFAAVINEMERAAFLGIPYLVMHPGAHMGAGTAAGIRRVVRGLKRALDRVGPPVKILLENTADREHASDSGLSILRKSWKVWMLPSVSGSASTPVTRMPRDMTSDRRRHMTGPLANSIVWWEYQESACSM